jgi:hypothetical protein
MPAVGAGHAREQKVTGIGSLLVPERKITRRGTPAYSAAPTAFGVFS